MAANFDLSNLALMAVCPGNEIKYDDKGMPSIMVKIPKLTLADLGIAESSAVHPAFIVNGSEVDAIWISKYINIVQNSRAYSLPGQDPANNMTFDTARGYCENKGAGWHMMTRMEWGMLLRWCQMNGVMPKGNNNYGKHVSESVQKALPMTYGTGADAGKIFHTATGTGPLTWNHDQTPSGIADLVGNISEWHGGIRRYGPELQILANNNGADSSNSQAANSAAWMAINGAATSASDLYLTPNGSGTTSGSVKIKRSSSSAMQFTTDEQSTSSNTTFQFKNLTCDATISDTAKQLLQSLGLVCVDADNDLYGTYEANFYVDAMAERLFHSGCYYGLPARGLSSFHSGNNLTRSNKNATIGFRSAFIQLPSA